MHLHTLFLHFYRIYKSTILPFSSSFQLYLRYLLEFHNFLYFKLCNLEYKKLYFEFCNSEYKTTIFYNFDCII